MKKKIMILTLICMAAAMTALIGTTAVAFADDDDVHVGSVEALENALSEVSGETDTVIVLDPREDGYQLNYGIWVPANTTIDLNGQKVYTPDYYAVYLGRENSSVTDRSDEGGGALIGGGVEVSGEDEGGSITNIQILGPRGDGVTMYGSGSVLGNIENCYIDGSGAEFSSNQCGIWLNSRASCGDIRNNTIVNMEYHGITLNGPSRTNEEESMGCAAGDIEGNIIENCKGDGISIYHGSHVGKITGNHLKNLGGHDTSTNGDFGIIINAGGGCYTYAEEITDNVLDGNTFAGIVVFGREKSKDGIHGIGYVAGDISGNTVIHSGNVAKKVNWYKSGKKPYACEAAIYVDDNGVVYGDIHDNVIQDCYMDGISVISNSEAQNIYNNKIIKNSATYGTRGSGIAVKSESVINGDIYNNTVKNTGYQGFFVYSKSKVLGSFHDNYVYKTKVNGVFVASSATVKTIDSNTIKYSGTYEVFAGSKGKITNLTNNEIIHNKKGTMAVLSNAGSAYIQKISGNKVSGKYSAGFRIKSPKVKVSILSNKMTSKSKSIFISVEKAKSKTVTIKSNKITGNGSGTGIWIRSSKSIIKSNTIKKVSTKISR